MDLDDGIEYREKGGRMVEDPEALVCRHQNPELMGSHPTELSFGTLENA